MLRNYLKTAINRIVKNKFFSLINIVGLVLGITVSLLILMYVVNELSYENFQSKRKNIYRITLLWGTSENIMKFAGAMPALADALNTRCPEVEVAVRIRKINDGVLKTEGNQEFREDNMFFADKDVFKIFSLSFLEGSKENALDAPFSAVISKSEAVKYFGNSDPIGKKLTFRDHPLEIRGIIDDVPANTHFRCEILVSYSTLRSLGEVPDKPWNQWGSDLTYILLKDKSSTEAIIPVLNGILLQNVGEWMASRLKFEIQPLTQVHWASDTLGDIGSKGNKAYVFVFLSAAILILTIACFNFLNLSITQYLGRMTEVAIRKTAGAKRIQLIFQYLTETILIVVISAVAAALLFDQFYLNLYSYLNTAYVIKGHHFMFLSAMVLAIILIVGFIAGSYPAIFISRMKPIDILRKETNGMNGRLTFRKILIMFQFAISFILLAGTIIIYRQLNYVKHTDLGFNKEDVLMLNFPGMDKENSKKYDILRDEFLKNPNIRYVSGAYTLPGINSRMNFGVTPAGMSPDNSVNLQALPADFGFVKSLDLQIIQGRDFSRDFITDRFGSVILNETAVRVFGLNNPVGTRLMIPGDDYKKGVTVIGVVKDFHIASYHEKINPMLIFINPAMFQTIVLKINPGNTTETLAYVKKVWNAALPGIDLNYKYLKSEYDNLYSTEEKSSRVLTFFTMLAIFISCLGLFGFASFVTGKRIKEIGIRKVLGGRSAGISILLSRQFIIWILISGLIACPVSYMLINKWLGNFAFHVKIEWWIFAAAAIFEFAIATLTVTLQTLNAVTRNPVEALRYE